MATPRGIRNNNPLNLRISDSAWLGKVPRSQNTDGAFEQFVSLAYGIRAAMKNIRTLCRRRPGMTMAQLIHAWAPASDGNNPSRYIAEVKRRSAIMPGEVILTHDKTMMSRLARAMAEVECGRAFDLSVFEDAYDLL